MERDIKGNNDNTEDSEHKYPDFVPFGNSEFSQRQKTCYIKDLPHEERPKLVSSGTVYLPRKMTVTQMMKKDNTDESLTNYKLNLLGEVGVINVKKAPEVEVVKIIVICEGRPDGDIEMDFSKDTSGTKASEFVIKSGSLYKMSFVFNVHNDIVYGLKYVSVVRKHGFIVDKNEEVMGTFAPTKESHTFDLTYEQAPDSLLSRGAYKGKAMLIDLDGFVHMQYEFNFKIKKKWA